MIDQKLMPLKDWREQRFVGTPPSVSTVKRWVRNGDIPTKKIGGSIFVILNEEMKITGDHLVDAVLSS